MHSGCHCHSLSLASVKSRLVLPFWYRLTWVVPDKGPLNGCYVRKYFFRYRSPPSPAMDPPLALQWLERWTRDSKSRRFDPRPSRFQVTTLGKLFAHMAGMSPLPGAFQVPPCDPIWRESSRSGEACCELIYTVYLYLFTRAPVSKQYNSVPIKRR